jgi:A/G-specific adenine glycosylase
MIDFHRLIIEWYRLNARSLPWRETKNPYFIWLSEVILQQTRVEQGLSYYLKFIKNYPTVVDLAKASEEDVLNDWQGLGYYSRARNLHLSAKMIVNKFKGDFPSEYKEVLSLKGVGEYAAAAITSFAYDLPYAVLDGNVFRVLSRVFDIDDPIDSSIGKKIFRELSQSLLPKNNSAEYNQAIMEFGAIQCKPKNPDCQTCVLNNNCLSYSKGVIDQRPVKSKKVKTRDRYFNYLILRNKESCFLRKRVEKDIWQHLYEFPMIETEFQEDFNTLKSMIEDVYGCIPLSSISVKKHVLSHQHIYANFFLFEDDYFDDKNEFEKVAMEDIQNFPLPRLIDRFLMENEIG